MPKTLTIGSTTADGIALEATFLPEMGLNMQSYRKGDVEVIDQSTQPLFEERFAGLGPLIGPHFHRRNSAIVPMLEEEKSFPHTKRVRSKGIHDPFSHGIGRYAPWKVNHTATSITGELTGKDEWNGVPLAKLEGQNFKMGFNAEMTPTGLQLQLSVVSDTDSLVGIHYYYDMGKGKARVTSDVKNHYRDHDVLSPIPQEWDYTDQGLLKFDLSRPADFGFFPRQNDLAGDILLETDRYNLRTRYYSTNQENTWQLYHPDQSSFVCIEPMSAKNPKKPILTVSSIRVSLEIL